MTKIRALGYSYMLIVVLSFGLFAGPFAFFALLPAITLILHKAYDGESKKSENYRLVMKKLTLLIGYFFLTYQSFFAPPNAFGAFYFAIVPVLQASSIMVSNLAIRMITTPLKNP